MRFLVLTNTSVEYLCVYTSLCVFFESIIVCLFHMLALSTFNIIIDSIRDNNRNVFNRKQTTSSFYLLLSFDLLFARTAEDDLIQDLIAQLELYRQENEKLRRRREASGGDGSKTLRSTGDNSRTDPVISSISYILQLLERERELEDQNISLREVRKKIKYKIIDLLF